MRKAGTLTNTVPEVWAATPRVRTVHARRASWKGVLIASAFLVQFEFRDNP